MHCPNAKHWLRPNLDLAKQIFDFMNSYLSNIKAVNKKVPKNASAAPNSLPTVPHEGAVSLEGISLPFGGRWPKAGGGL